MSGSGYIPLLKCVIDIPLLEDVIMATKYVEYKKRRLIKLEQRVQEQDELIAELRAEVFKLRAENSELKSQVYYYETSQPRKR